MSDKFKSRKLLAWLVPRRSRFHWMQWLRDEYVYSDGKFESARETEHDKYMAEEGVDINSWWENQVFQYIRRANALGLDNPLGRQALAKGLACYTGMLESCIRVYGELPKPGVPSGELRP